MLAPHTVSVLLFCAAGICHYAAMVRDHRPGGKAQHFFRIKWPLYLILGTGGGAFAGVTAIAVLNYSEAVTLTAVPLLFWAFECLGLSSFVLYVPA